MFYLYIFKGDTSFGTRVAGMSYCISADSIVRRMQDVAEITEWIEYKVSGNPIKGYTIDSELHVESIEEAVRVLMQEDFEIYTFAIERARLESLGYTEFTGFAEDAKLVQEDYHCGCPMQYKAFHNGDSYRPFAVCSVCGHYYEF